MGSFQEYMLELLERKHLRSVSEDLEHRVARLERELEKLKKVLTREEKL
jgi:hypothetical protein